MPIFHIRASQISQGKVRGGSEAMQSGEHQSLSEAASRVHWLLVEKSLAVGKPMIIYKDT